MGHTSPQASINLENSSRGVTYVFRRPRGHIRVPSSWVATTLFWSHSTSQFLSASELSSGKNSCKSAILFFPMLICRCPPQALMGCIPEQSYKIKQRITEDEGWSFCKLDWYQHFQCQLKDEMNKKNRFNNRNCFSWPSGFWKNRLLSKSGPLSSKSIRPGEVEVARVSHWRLGVRQNIYMHMSVVTNKQPSNIPGSANERSRCRLRSCSFGLSVLPAPARLELWRRICRRGTLNRSRFYQNSEWQKPYFLRLWLLYSIYLDINHHIQFLYDHYSHSCFFFPSKRETGKIRMSESRELTHAQTGVVSTRPRLSRDKPVLAWAESEHWAWCN